MLIFKSLPESIFSQAYFKAVSRIRLSKITLASSQEFLQFNSLLLQPLQFGIASAHLNEGSSF
jgi:hypothetical protein